MTTHYDGDSSDPSLAPLTVAEWIGRLKHPPKRAYAAAYASARLQGHPHPTPPANVSRDWPARVRRRVDELLAQTHADDGDTSRVSAMIELVKEAAGPGGDGDTERQRLERLFVSSGYAPPLAPIYGVVIRPFDEGEEPTDALLDAHQTARRVLTSTLRRSDSGNPGGGHIEAVLVELANDLLAAAHSGGAVAAELRIQTALDRLAGVHVEEADLVPVPERPANATTDRRGLPVGLWR